MAESAGFDRLVIVTLHRGHTYHGIERVKEEVSDKALELAQENLPEKRKVYKALTSVYMHHQDTCISALCRAERERESMYSVCMCIVTVVHILVSLR